MSAVATVNAVRSSGHAVGAGIAALLIAVVAFFYRFNTLGGAFGGFGNDEFIFLSRARQVVGGDLPFRDFNEPGAPLMTLSSAAVQWWLGYNLFGHALHTLIALAVAVGIGVWLCARVTGRVWPGALFGLLIVALGPRPYNYAKLLFTALGLWLCWRYVDRPLRARLLAIGACIGIAFLFRHDFVVYLGVLAASTVLLVHRRELELGIRALITIGVVCLACIVPFLAFLQVAGGVGEYVRSATVFTTADAARTEFSAPRFDLRLSGPLLSIAPVAPRPAPRVHVTWAPDLPEANRRAAEERYGLVRGEPRQDTTWTYEATDGSRATLEALVRDPAVRDTHHIDRATFRLNIAEPEDRGWFGRLRRVRVAPELTREDNLVAWMYYTLAALPVVAALAWVARYRSSDVDGVALEATIPYLWPLILFAGLLAIGFLTRGTIVARLADAAVPMSVLAAWLLAPRMKPGSISLSSPPRSNAVSLRMLLRTAGIVVLLVSIWSVAHLGAVRSKLDTGGWLNGPSAVAGRTSVVYSTLSLSPPLRSVTGDAESAVIRLARYIDRCTSPDARVFVFGHLPELYFFSGRRFAGGHVWILPGYYTDPVDQRRIVERLRAYEVPIVVTEEEPRYVSGYRPTYPIVDDYLSARYRNAGSFALGGETMQVLVARDGAWPGRDESTGLPCAER